MPKKPSREFLPYGLNCNIKQKTVSGQTCGLPLYFRYKTQKIKKVSKTQPYQWVSALSFWSKCGGIDLWAIFLHSPLKSELFDGFVWNANSILLRRVKFSSPTPAKRKQTTARAVCSLLVEAAGFCSKGTIFLHSPLESELFDGFVWNANSILLRRVKFSSPTPAKRKQTTTRDVCSLLVEVWRFELQVSSTRIAIFAFLTIKVYI